MKLVPEHQCMHFSGEEKVQPAATLAFPPSPPSVITNAVARRALPKTAKHLLLHLASQHKPGFY